MKVKAKLGLVALLACCSMVGMGFAGWTISQDPSALTASVTGTVTAESVLSCSAPEIGDLHYSSLGFTSEEGTAFSYTTTFTVTYTITSGGYTGDATLTATMGYDKTVANNLFAAENADKKFLSAAVTGATMSEGFPKFENNTYVLSGKVSCAAGSEVEVVITYTLNFGTDVNAASNYNDYFYNIFKSNTGDKLTDVAFTFNATLEGGKA